jgi:hypothetical protein
MQDISSSDPVLSSSEKAQYWQLKLFDAMTHDERQQRFARLLGGTRILDSVGGVLNPQWGVSNARY